jgi:hypothetical protein
MSRQSSSGKLQVNLSFDSEAYAILARYAATRKGYGQFLGELLRQFARQHEQDSLRERVERLERQLAGAP